MSISVKSRFAGLLRGLLRQMDGGDAPPRSPSIAPQPAIAPAAPAPNFTAPPRPVRADEIELPLAPVITALPMDLRAKLMSVPAVGMTICLPVETVTSQLAFGAVKITFGELRQLAAGLFANSGGELDSRPVSLPLQEILSRLNPALLARRPGSAVKVSEEIVGPFTGRGQGLAFTTQPLKAPAAPKPPTPPPAPMPAVPVTFTPPAPRQMAPPPVAPPAPPLASSNRYSLPISPLTPRPILPPPNGTNGNGHTMLPPSTLPPPPLTLKLSAAPVPPVPPLPPAPVALPTAAPRPEPVQPTIFAAFSDLSENWPPEIKNEIARLALAELNVPLAGATIVPGLKRGRVTMTWKQIRTLARPSSPPSPNDDSELELPLKVLAPLFFAAQKNLVRPQPKPAVTADIPDLFFGFPQPAAAPAPPAMPPPTAPAPKPPDTNFYVWGENGEQPQSDEQTLNRPVTPATDFTSRLMHPKDVVARAVTLPGVAGALVALTDGLRVASEVPAELNADALSAFLPQIFERLNQSTRELRMGALNNVNFTVGNVPWKIFRVNSVYFAAFGRAGESLPAAPLAQLAGELDRKKKQ